MESSNKDNKKPELGFHAYQIREAGSSSGETSLHLIGLFPSVYSDGEKKRKNYHGCLVCDGLRGAVFPCSNCQRTFHPRCLGLESFPEGNWTCLKCCDDEVFKPKTDLVSEERNLMTKEAAGAV